MPKANDRQVGGDHYASAIQHWDYVLANRIPYLESMVIKYLTRWRDKNGYQDLDKAMHFMEKIVEQKGQHPDYTVDENSEHFLSAEEEVSHEPVPGPFTESELEFVDTAEPQSRGYVDQDGPPVLRRLLFEGRLWADTGGMGHPEGCLIVPVVRQDESVDGSAIKRNP